MFSEAFGFTEKLASCHTPWSFVLSFVSASLVLTEMHLVSASRERLCGECGLLQWDLFQAADVNFIQVLLLVWKGFVSQSHLQYGLSLWETAGKSLFWFSNATRSCVLSSYWCERGAKTGLFSLIPQKSSQTQKLMLALIERGQDTQFRQLAVYRAAHGDLRWWIMFFFHTVWAARCVCCLPGQETTSGCSVGRR